MKNYRAVMLLFLLILIGKASSFAQTMGTIEKTECFLKNCNTIEDLSQLEFGYITVPENYDRPDQRLIKVAFVIIKSQDANPKADPVMVFQGGWGMPLLDATPAYMRNFPIKDRDVILFDYRGTGFSEPKLCDWIGPEAWQDLTEDLSHKEFQANQTKRFNTCLDSLQLRQIDFNQYGSNTKTRDLVLLAEGLGYESYNLFGISYGTRAILNFIRNAENSPVHIRSALLDSNSPIGMTGQGQMTISYEDVLKKILKDCENDPACDAAYPQLKDRFVTFLKSLDSDPWVVPLEDDKTFTFNKEEMNGNLHQMLYRRSLYKNIPALIERLIARDNDLFRMYMTQPEQLVKEGYNGLGLINFVYDHKAFQAEYAQLYKEQIAKNSPYEVLAGYMDFYTTDRRIATDSLEHIPVLSDIPALFLAGTYDPITPPAWTKFTAKGFSNHYYIEVPRVGHGIAPTPCGEKLMTQFFDNPKQRPDNGCFDALGENPIAFTTQYYNNTKVGLLANKLQGLDWLTTLGMGFILVISLINFIKTLGRLLRRKKDAHWKVQLPSALTFLFLFGLIYFVMQTLNQDAFLLLLGLGAGAKWIFWLIPLVLLGTIVGLGYVLKHGGRWNIVSALSLIVFVILVINFNLYPNF